VQPYNTDIMPIKLKGITENFANLKIGCFFMELF
jgi:hypothetical protein